MAREAVSPLDQVEDCPPDLVEDFQRGLEAVFRPDQAGDCRQDRVEGSLLVQVVAYRPDQAVDFQPDRVVAFRRDQAGAFQLDPVAVCQLDHAEAYPLGHAKHVRQGMGMRSRKMPISQISTRQSFVFAQQNFWSLSACMVGCTMTPRTRQVTFQFSQMRGIWFSVWKGVCSRGLLFPGRAQGGRIMDPLTGGGCSDDAPGTGCAGVAGLQLIGPMLTWCCPPDRQCSR